MINFFEHFILLVFSPVHITVAAPTNGFVQSRVEETVVFFLEVSVGAAMEREFATLAEGFHAAVDSADEGLLVCVRILVFAEVLRQGEHFAAKAAWKCLLPTVDVVVPF